MPPSSRKRNKGKDRKAKQLAKKEENERSSVHKLWTGWAKASTCNHGCDAMIPDDHPVSSFIEKVTALLNLTNLFETHRHIWNDEPHRRLALNILMNIGTNMLLGRKEIDISWPVGLAQSIVVLEQYNGTDDIDLVMNSRVVSSKNIDLNLGSRRDCLKFYRKRISCKCLKRMHQEARRTQPKMGLCYGCDGEIERVALSVCGRCMITSFCSKECQVAAWPYHKRICDDYVNADGTRGE